MFCPWTFQHDWDALEANHQSHDWEITALPLNHSHPIIICIRLPSYEREVDLALSKSLAIATPPCILMLCSQS